MTIPQTLGQELKSQFEKGGVKEEEKGEGKEEKEKEKSTSEIFVKGEVNSLKGGTSHWSKSKTFIEEDQDSLNGEEDVDGVSIPPKLVLLPRKTLITSSLSTRRALEDDMFAK